MTEIHFRSLISDDTTALTKFLIQLLALVLFIGARDFITVHKGNKVASALLLHSGFIGYIQLFILSHFLNSPKRIYTERQPH